MVTLIEVRNSQGVIGRCDERCYDAIGGKCDCCCGGVNHGVGLNKAVANLSRMYNDVILANTLEDVSQAKVVRPKLEPVLFEYEKERKPLPGKEKPQKKAKKAAPTKPVEAQG